MMEDKIKRSDQVNWKQILFIGLLLFIVGAIAQISIVVVLIAFLIFLLLYLFLRIVFKTE